MRPIGQWWLPKEGLTGTRGGENLCSLTYTERSRSLLCRRQVLKNVGEYHQTMMASRTTSAYEQSDRKNREQHDREHRQVAFAPVFAVTMQPIGDHPPKRLTGTRGENWWGKFWLLQNVLAVFYVKNVRRYYQTMITPKTTNSKYVNGTKQWEPPRGTPWQRATDKWRLRRSSLSPSFFLGTGSLWGLTLARYEISLTQRGRECIGLEIRNHEPPRYQLFSYPETFIINQLSLTSAVKPPHTRRTLRAAPSRALLKTGFFFWKKKIDSENGRQPQIARDRTLAELPM